MSGRGAQSKNERGDKTGGAKEKEEGGVKQVLFPLAPHFLFSLYTSYKCI